MCILSLKPAVMMFIITLAIFYYLGLDWDLVWTKQFIAWKAFKAIILMYCDGQCVIIEYLCSRAWHAKYSWAENVGPTYPKELCHWILCSMCPHKSYQNFDITCIIRLIPMSWAQIFQLCLPEPMKIMFYKRIKMLRMNWNHLFIEFIYPTCIGITLSSRFC